RADRSMLAGWTAGAHQGPPSGVERPRAREQGRQPAALRRHQGVRACRGRSGAVGAAYLATRYPLQILAAVAPVEQGEIGLTCFAPPAAWDWGDWCPSIAIGHIRAAGRSIG